MKAHTHEAPVLANVQSGHWGAFSTAGGTRCQHSAWIVNGTPVGRIEMSGTMRFLFIAAVLFSVVGTFPVHAQSDFSGVRIKPGDVIFVTEPSGKQVSGRLTRLSPSVLTIDGQEFKPAAGLKIERRGDPVWDGALKGFAIGAVVGTILGSGECSVDWPLWKCTVAGGVWFAAFGTVFDLGHVGRTKVYVGTSDPSTRLLRDSAPASKVLALQIAF